jgi:hypothetical protein
MALSTYPAEWISIRVSSFIRKIKASFINLFKCFWKIKKNQETQETQEIKDNFPYQKYYEEKKISLFKYQKNCQCRVANSGRIRQC